MLAPDEIGLWSTLSIDTRSLIVERLQRQAFPAGATILRKGLPCRALYAVAEGTAGAYPLGVSAGSGWPLYAGSIFGEMSLLTGSPASATVRATTDVQLYRLDEPDFQFVLQRDPGLAQAIGRLLAERLRHRTSARSIGAGPSCVILVTPSFDPRWTQVIEPIAETVQRYVPGSRLLSEPSPEARKAGAGSEGALREIQCWRQQGHRGDVLLVRTAPDALRELSDWMEVGDAVLAFTDGDDSWIEDTREFATGHGIHHAVVRMAGSQSHSSEGDPERAWAFQLPWGADSCAGDLPSCWSAPLHRIARWVTQRQVGFALGSGAARGFAHLGVLQSLQQAGIPLDCMSGCSMGGLLAVMVGFHDSVENAIEAAAEVAGSNRKVFDSSWLPRSSILHGRKVARGARAAFGDATFADLRFPVRLVAADLVHGRQVVLDRGPLVPACLATSAIPGVFPPVRLGDGALVDGALVSRVPVGLLDTFRCGVVIAVNVIAETTKQGEPASSVDYYWRRCNVPFGFKRVLGDAWAMLSWWHGNSESSAADILIEPATDQFSGYQFGRIRELVELGREHATQSLDEIRSLVEERLRPNAV